MNAQTARSLVLIVLLALAGSTAYLGGELASTQERVTSLEQENEQIERANTLLEAENQDLTEENNALQTEAESLEEALSEQERSKLLELYSQPQWVEIYDYRTVNRTVDIQRVEHTDTQQITKTVGVRCANNTIAYNSNERVGVEEHSEPVYSISVDSGTAVLYEAEYPFLNSEEVNISDAEAEQYLSRCSEVFPEQDVYTPNSTDNSSGGER